MIWKQPIRIAMNALVTLGMQTMPAVALPADIGEGAALIAVHDYSASPALTGKDISGWWIAEAMANKLTPIGRFRIIIRAKISKVLKEKNIASDGSLPLQDFGKLAGSQFVVTGQADYAAGNVRMTARLIHMSEKTGEIERSFEACRECREDEISDCFPELVGELAKKLSMTPGEFLDSGLGAMSDGDFESAVSAFTELSRGQGLNEIAALAAKVPTQELQELAMRIAVPGNTLGEMLDDTMMLLNKGDAEQAAGIFPVAAKQACRYHPSSDAGGQRRTASPGGTDRPAAGRSASNV